MTKPAKISPRERRILRLLYPDKTLAVGLSVCERLHGRGLIEIDWARNRYRLTSAGRAEIAQKELSL
ncbi:hypothetical protein KQX64_06845 [Rhodopseudomonas palustris]|nr:hypothetical protein KQX64_06845 [Rhodopseudomonas palustris]